MLFDDKHNIEVEGKNLYIFRLMHVVGIATDTVAMI